MPKLATDKETLDKAAAILQGAHDLIETRGFNIDTYGGSRYSQAHDPTPMCYIGTIRYIRGLEPSPAAEATEAAADGDGPELVVALATLDKIAKRRMTSEQRQETKQEWTHMGENALNRGEIGNSNEDPAFWSIGRFVENFGFAIQDKAHDKYPDDTDAQIEYQTTYALKLLRRALTEIYR